MLWVLVLFGVATRNSQGITLGVPYVGLILMSLWLQERWYVHFAVLAGTVFTLINMGFSHSDREIVLLVSEHFIDLFAIWITGILCYVYKRDEAILEERARELGESLTKLEEFNQRLQEASRHESQFLSSMSHELRTPLNAIMGFTDLLQGQFFGKLNEKQLGYISQIEKSGRHLLDLINDLLDMAKIDAGATSVEWEEFHPRECLLTVDLMNPQFRKKDLQVETFLDPNLSVMTGDRRKCKQIMLNLLSNAYKYTPRNGRIDIRIVPEKGGVKISVTDTGIGISKKDQSRIFSEFQQSNRARDEGLGGTGIGLALTRRLVKLHGGEIGVQSELHEGSTFWFTLPHKRLAKKEEVKPEDRIKAELTNKTGNRILVAEDNKVNMSMILDMLSVYDHKVFVAHNGQEAIEAAITHEPDLILMDIRMPRVDGLEATRRLRKMAKFSKTPIIALTASVGSETREKCLQAGCSKHLSKPIQSKELFDAIKHYLGENHRTKPTGLNLGFSS
ncbi:MAG: response regulator [Nitrospinaceae bacterium]|nr:MAG: response regulator [Nitrospinaceae bacterium]